MNPGRFPTDLPDMRIEFAAAWMPDGKFDRVARLKENIVRIPAMWSNWELVTLRGASLYWVSEDMVDLLTAAAPSVPDDVVVEQLPPPRPRRARRPGKTVVRD